MHERAELLHREIIRSAETTGKEVNLTEFSSFLSQEFLGILNVCNVENN